MDVIESFLDNLDDDPIRQDLFDRINDRIFKDLDKYNKGYITQKDLKEPLNIISRELYGLDLPSNCALLMSPVDIPEIQKDKIFPNDFKKLVPYILMAIASDSRDEDEDEDEDEEIMIVDFVQKKKGGKHGNGKK
jgi:hypothetical protein